MRNRQNVLTLVLVLLSLVSAAVIMVLSNKLYEARNPGTLKLHSLSKSPNIPTKLTNIRRIVCAGDSITAGEGCSLNYVIQLRQYLDAIYPGRFEVIKLGKNGATAGTLYQFLKGEIETAKPDLLFVFIGINDLGEVADRKKSEKELLLQFHKNLSAIAELSKPYAKRLIFVSGFLATEYPDSRGNQLMQEFADEMKSVATEKQCEIVQVNKEALNILRAYRKTGAADQFLTVDGIHPNFQGHQIITNCLLTALEIDHETRDSIMH